MYMAVILAISGQALLWWRPVLLPYGVLVAAAMVAFVLAHEQPALDRQFGDEYATYAATCPAGFPAYDRGEARVRPEALGPKGIRTATRRVFDSRRASAGRTV